RHGVRLGGSKCARRFACMKSTSKKSGSEKVMATVTGRPNTYLEAYGELTARRQQRDPVWLRQLREDAWTRFQDKGFPTTHDEDWRFTNLAAMAKIPFQRAVKGSVAVSALPI